MNKNFVDALEAKLAIEQKVNDLAAVLQKYPRGKMGLTPDEVKFSPEYKKDKQAFDMAFQKQRDFNKVFLKVYSKEYREYQKQKKAAKIANNNQ